jgi:hypothetical protein
MVLYLDWNIDLSLQVTRKKVTLRYVESVTESKTRQGSISTHLKKTRVLLLPGIVKSSDNCYDLEVDA